MQTNTDSVSYKRSWSWAWESCRGKTPADSEGLRAARDQLASDKQEMNVFKSIMGKQIAHGTGK